MPATLSPDEIRQRIDPIHWWHRIEVAPGVWTAGNKKAGTQDCLELIHMPADLGGRTVLDVGAWDGFYSFEAERRGAARVLATDSFVWREGAFPGCTGKRGFLLARELLGSKVEDQDIDVLDLDPEVVGTFDVVLFLGVLYHMRHPLLSVEKVAAVTDGLLIGETHVDLRLGNDIPKAVFYPGRELMDDPTNWWGFNPLCVVEMLRVAGFKKVETFLAPYQLWRLEQPASAWQRFRNRRRADRAARKGRDPWTRMAFHAWK